MLFLKEIRYVKRYKFPKITLLFFFNHKNYFLNLKLKSLLKEK